MRFRTVTNIVFSSLVVLLIVGQATAQQSKNRVVLMGMTHSRHLNSETYGLDLVRETIRKIKPDVVFCEIPPDRIEEANKQFKESGKITESRVRVFPEYVDVLYPLTKEMDFEMCACAGWTREMAIARQKKLKELQQSQPKEHAEMVSAQFEMQAAVLRESGGADNPRFIHSQEYDDLVKKGMSPYDKHFNEALGPGGWTNINQSHYSLVEKNLERFKGRKKTILIMFGAAHKYWFKEKLKQRDDIELVNLNQFLPPKPKEESDSEDK